MTVPSPEKILVGPASHFQEDSRQLVKHGTRNIAVVHHKKRFYAIDNACYHHGGPLLQGDIEDMGGHVCIVCPWHSYRIALDSGEGLYIGVDIQPGGGPPKQVLRSKGCKQRVHKVVVEDGNVYVIVDLSGDTWPSDEYANMAIANREDGMMAPLASGGPRHSSLHSGMRSGQVLQKLSPGLVGVNPLGSKEDTSEGDGQAAGGALGKVMPMRLYKPIAPERQRGKSKIPASSPSPLSSASPTEGSPTGVASRSSSYSTDLVLSCSKVVNLCKDVKEYHFHRTSGTLLRQVEMGEYVEIELQAKDAQGVQLRRKWTICDTNLPGGTLFTLIIKANRKNSDGASMWMNNYALYTTMRVCQVAGRFTFVDHMARIRELQGHVLWLTAGIGITSAYATINSTLNDAFFVNDTNEKLHLVHLHVDRTADAIAKFDVFQQWAETFAPEAAADATHSKQYVFHGFLSQQFEPAHREPPAWANSLTYGRRMGPSDIVDATTHFFGNTPFLCYVCGPPEFCNDCANTLLSMGVSETDILMDDP